jgi:hypothetical protein
MLDEVDKIGTDFRGDPSSALWKSSILSRISLSVIITLRSLLTFQRLCIATPTCLTHPSGIEDRMKSELPGIRKKKSYDITTVSYSQRTFEHGLTEDNIEFEDKQSVSIIRSNPERRKKPR